MEADDGRGFFHQHLQHGVVVGRETLVDRAQFGRGRRPERLEQGRERLDPTGLPHGIGLGRGVHEEVDVEGAVGSGPDLPDHPARGLRVRRAQSDGAEAARIGHGRGEFRRRDPRHRRLHDRNGHSEAADEGHGFDLGRRRMIEKGRLGPIPDCPRANAFARGGRRRERQCRPA